MAGILCFFGVLIWLVTVFSSVNYFSSDDVNVNDYNPKWNPEKNTYE